MKKRISNIVRFILGLGLVTSFSSIPPDQLTAQTFTILHTFTATNGMVGTFGTNVDGAVPYGGLVLSGNSLYGTTRFGGAGGGVVFKLNIDGTGFTTLHSFPEETGPFFTNSDGGGLRPSLTLSGDTLYGTARSGGYSGLGTVFKVNTDGSGFRLLHTFSAASAPLYINGDGANPWAGLILVSNTLYGATTFGGSSGNGTVFALNADGTGFTNLHTFAAGFGTYPETTNTEGANPFGRLVLSGNILYGTAADGGSLGVGAVFALNTDGTGFTNLHSFDWTSGNGFNPVTGLVLSDGILYGTTLNGGVGGVFRINTDGSGFANVYDFSALSGSGPYSNNDGADPRAGLILSGHTLYGTAEIGGIYANSPDFFQGSGTVFAVNTDGTGFMNLHNFTSGSDGAGPQSSLILSGNVLYGTAALGGDSGNGTVYSIALPAPQLTATPSGANLVLTWPTDNAGFDYTGYALQSTINLGSPATWTTNSSSPVIVNGQNTVTAPLSGTQQFFRLNQ